MPALAKRILNPDNKWLWIAGGAVVLGGTWLYFSRKKKDETPVDKGPTNFVLVSTKEEAEKLALEPVSGKVLIVWERFSPPELLALTKEEATNHGGVKFYFFKEAALSEWMPNNVVAVISAGEDGLLKYRGVIQDDSVQPAAEAVSKFQEAVLALTEPGLAGIPTDVATFEELWQPFTIGTFVGDEAP